MLNFGEALRTIRGPLHSNRCRTAGTRPLAPPERIDHDRHRPRPCPFPRILRRGPRAIESPDRGLRRPHAGARPGVPRLPEGDGGHRDGRALSQVFARGQERALVRAHPGRAQGPPPLAASVLGDPFGEHPRSGHVDAARGCCESGSTSWGSTSPSSTRPWGSSSSTSPRRTCGAPAAGPRMRWCPSSTATTRIG